MIAVNSGIKERVMAGKYVTQGARLRSVKCETAAPSV